MEVKRRIVKHSNGMYTAQTVRLASKDDLSKGFWEAIDADSGYLWPAHSPENLHRYCCVKTRDEALELFKKFPVYEIDVESIEEL